MTKKQKILQLYIIPILIVLISVIFAVIFNDYFFGFITFACGFLNAYYMAIGRWENYIFGIVFSVFYAIVCYKNGLYGFAIFTVIAYIPLQIVGLVGWFKKQSNNSVIVKSLSLKKGILLTLGVCGASFLLGFLLDLIPTQNMSYLDSTSQIINLAGAILSVMRYRECWFVLLANNSIDLAIWIINAINHTANAEMMLVTSIMYLVMNIYGLLFWIFIERKQRQCMQNLPDEELIEENK